MDMDLGSMLEEESIGLAGVLGMGWGESRKTCKGWAWQLSRWGCGYGAKDHCRRKSCAPGWGIHTRVAGFKSEMPSGS